MSQTVEFRFIFLSLIFGILSLSLSAVAVMSKELKNIPIELAFEAYVESPNHLSLCGGSLWTFSVSTQKLVAVDPKSGGIINMFSLLALAPGKESVDLGALTCRGGHLFVLVNDAPVGRILEFQTQLDSFKLVSQYPLPEKGRATDLFCNESQCWLLQEHPLLTVNFKKWQKTLVPSPAGLKKVYRHPELDPFEDWQRSLVLAKSKYTKGAIDSQNQYVFMDPFHAQAVIQSGGEFVKWGSFGAWEGSFLSPKAMTFVRDNALAVADAKLKAIFLFKRDGTYLGVLAWGPQLIFSPDYPLGLASDGRRLFVADFRAHKIYAVDMKEHQTKLEGIAPLTVRQNLFRREEVLKDNASSMCLNCHDGTISNQLFKFVKLSFHHPLECSQCHDPHHKIKARNYLKDQPEKLCLSCHKDFSDPKTNHVGGDPHKSGGKCMDCHRGHADTEKLLIEPIPSLCISCHKDKVFTHKSVEDISILEKTKNIHTERGKIDCQTCHQTHVNWKETKFIKKPGDLVPFCSSCHGDKSPALFKNFHKLIKLKKGSGK